MDPAEDQRKGDQHRQHAAPEEELVHPPAQDRALADEGLGREVGPGQRQQAAEAAQDAEPADELPAAAPVDLRRRLLQPDPVVVDHAPGGEDRGEGVDHQGRIEILQVARADHDGGHQGAGPEGGPGAGPQPVGGAGQLGRQGQLQRLLARHEHPAVDPPERARPWPRAARTPARSPPGGRGRSRGGAAGRSRRGRPWRPPGR